MTTELASKTCAQTHGDKSETDSLLLQGDIYQGRAGQTLETPELRLPFRQSVDDTARPSGGDLLARWTRRHSETSETVL